MVTTDPAYRYRNECIKFLVEAYDMDGWSAFQIAGEACITEGYYNNTPYIDACNEQLMRNDYDAATR